MARARLDLDLARLVVLKALGSEGLEQGDDKALGCLFGAFRLEGGERGVFSSLFPSKFCKISTTFLSISGHFCKIHEQK